MLFEATQHMPLPRSLVQQCAAEQTVPSTQYWQYICAASPGRTREAKALRHTACSECELNYPALANLVDPLTSCMAL